MSLQVRGLRSGYGRLEVLRGVDLDVGEGELVAVIGANGAGKTTLLRTVSGLLRATGGTVTLAGTDVTGLAPEQLAGRGLAHVPENRLVFPTLTVQDNLLLGAYTRRRRPAADRRADQERALALFPRLADRLAQAAGTLSGGEQQMLAIARGLMARPRVLVLDEPSVGLAPRLVGEIFTALGALRDDGLTLLLIEQNTRAAFTVADRGYIMARGAVAMEGTPDTLLSDSRVQATYLGGDFSTAAPAEGGATGSVSPATPAADGG